MKKLVTFLLIISLMMTTGVFAAEKIPEELLKNPQNYTADYTISMTFEDSSDIVSLLKEMEMPDEIDTFIDVEMLLESLFTNQSKIKVQADYDEDYKKMKLGMTVESSQKIDINPNFNMGFNEKMGMWIDMDFTNEENPILEYIVSQPFMNKYMHMDMSSILEDADWDAMKTVMNKEYIEQISNVLYKHVEIEKTFSGYTLKIGNEEFTALMDELIAVISEYIIPQEQQDVAFEQEFPSFKDMRFLGEDGIKCDYKVKNGIVTEGKMTADISIDISQIYTAITGEEWWYDASGKIDLELSETFNIYKAGSTNVEFPVLTEENSVSYNEMMSDMEADYQDDDSEYEPEYPNYYTYGMCEAIPVIDGEIYVPLRITLVSAYEDTVAINYDNGVITATCEYFDGFRTLSLTVGTDKAYTDGAEHTIGNVLVIGNDTYVNSKLFQEIFGWRLANANHNLLTGKYNYHFFTQTY